MIGSTRNTTIRVDHIADTADTVVTVVTVDTVDIADIVRVVTAVPVDTVGMLRIARIVRTALTVGIVHTEATVLIIQTAIVNRLVPRIAPMVASNRTVHPGNVVECLRESPANPRQLFGSNVNRRATNRTSKCSRPTVHCCVDHVCVINRNHRCRDPGIRFPMCLRNKWYQTNNHRSHRNNSHRSQCRASSISISINISNISNNNNNRSLITLSSRSR